MYKTCAPSEALNAVYVSPAIVRTCSRTIDITDSIIDRVMQALMMYRQFDDRSKKSVIDSSVYLFIDDNVDDVRRIMTVLRYLYGAVTDEPRTQRSDRFT